MEFTQPGEPGRVKTVDVSHEQRNRYSITDEDVIELAKYAVIIEKH
jgi:pyruvate,water dikinase